MMQALLLALLASPTVVLHPEPEAEKISLQAVVRLPRLGPQGLAVAKLVTECLEDDNGSYGRVEMRNLCLPGEEPKADLFQDCIWIRFSVAPPDLFEACGVMDGILRNPRFRAEMLNEKLKVLPTQHMDYWSTALQPFAPDWRRIRESDVWDFYRSVFKPENIFVGLGGALGADAQQTWESASGEWTEDRRYHPVDISEPKDFETNSSSVSTVELRGAPFNPGSSTLPAKYLALIALGVGKGSALHRIVRDEKGFSYRQEGVLTGSPEGLVPRLILVIKPRTEQSQVGWLAREALQADVDKRSEVDLKRAIGFASIYLQRGIPVSPMYLHGANPLDDTLEDRLFMSIYWRMKTGTNWVPSDLLSKMQRVTLEELKTEANAMLANTSVHVVAAQGN